MNILKLITREQLAKRLKGHLFVKNHKAHYCCYWDDCFFYEFEARDVYQAHIELHKTHLPKIKRLVVKKLKAEKSNVSEVTSHAK